MRGANLEMGIRFLDAARGIGTNQTRHGRKNYSSSAAAHGRMQFMPTTWATTASTATATAAPTWLTTPPASTPPPNTHQVQDQPGLSEIFAYAAWDEAGAVPHPAAAKDPGPDPGPNKAIERHIQNLCAAPARNRSAA